MTPLQRCGSHAIRLRLAQNPAFYSPHPLNVIDFMPLADLYGELEDETYFQLIQDLVGLQNVNMVRWPGVVLDPVTLFEALADRPRGVHAVVWEMMTQAAEQHDAAVVMDKSCESVRFAGEYMELLGDLRLLNVVRDPRAQVNSVNRAIIHDFDSLLNARRWVQAHDMAVALAERYPDRVLTIRYEDFINTPEPVLREVCEFLGIEYLDAMLDVGTSSEARRIAGRSALWETNNKPPIPANIDKFTRQLTPEEILLIETITAGYMRRYGYELMTAADAAITSEQAEQARERSAEARERAWRELRARDPRDYQLRRYRAWYLGALRERLATGAVEASVPMVPAP
jgi:sulfotransferase family protein